MNALMVINAILFIGACIEIILDVSIVTDLLVYYADDIETALTAVAMPQCITGIVISVLILIFVAYVRHLMGDARFFSEYMELNLSGTVTYEELSRATGKPAGMVHSELSLLRKIFMTGFKLDKNAVELDSKKVQCVCRNCGAAIETKAYFAGACSYCGSLDINAQVITGKRFYSIKSDFATRHSSTYYTSEKFTARRVYIVVCMALSAFLFLINIMMMGTRISDYNNEDFLRETLLDPNQPLRSYALIKADILSDIVWNIIAIIGFGILIAVVLRKLFICRTADESSSVFARSKNPFITEAEAKKSISAKRPIVKVGKCIRVGYLRNVCIECPEQELKIALAKTIVKDKCPSCAASIVGPVDENYTCKYCGNVITGVMKKA